MIMYVRFLHLFKGVIINYPVKIQYKLLTAGQTQLPPQCRRDIQTAAGTS